MTGLALTSPPPDRFHLGDNHFQLDDHLIVDCGAFSKQNSRLVISHLGKLIDFVWLIDQRTHSVRMRSTVLAQVVNASRKGAATKQCNFVSSQCVNLHFPFIQIEIVSITMEIDKYQCFCFVCFCFSSSFFLCVGSFCHFVQSHCFLMHVLLLHHRLNGINNRGFCIRTNDRLYWSGRWIV